MKTNKYKLTFKFFDTEKEALSFVKSRGRRKHTVTDWTSSDGEEHKKLCGFTNKKGRGAEKLLFYCLLKYRRMKIPYNRFSSFTLYTYIP